MLPSRRMPVRYRRETPLISTVGAPTMAAPEEKPKVSEKEKAADSREAREVSTAPEPAPEPKKADLTKAAAAREKAIGSAKFVCNHPVGEHAAGAVVERTKFGKFVGDDGKHDQEAYDANIGRLLDLGAISPAPEGEK